MKKKKKKKKILKKIKEGKKKEKKTTKKKRKKKKITGQIQWVKDLPLQWMWCRPAALAQFQPLARELVYAMSVALKSKKKKKKKKILKNKKSL